MNRKAAIVGVLLLASIVWAMARPSASEVMRDFHVAKDRAGDMLMDPLILHAGIARESVIREVANPSMPKRRYAIGFLGIDGNCDSLPVLRQILKTESEIDCYRADALSAIWQIARPEALELAQAYCSRDDLLGRFAREIGAGTHMPVARSYWQALVGFHE